jgi:hypothetical protein
MDYSVCGFAKHLLLCNVVQHLLFHFICPYLNRKQLQNCWTYITKFGMENFMINHRGSSNFCLHQTIAMTILHEDYVYFWRCYEQNLLNMYHKKKSFQHTLSRILKHISYSVHFFSKSYEFSGQANKLDTTHTVTDRCFLCNNSQNTHYIRCEHCYATASGTKVDTRSITLTIGNSKATELLKSTATLTQPFAKVSSLRGANILLQGQQNNGRRQKENTEEDHRR